MLLNWNKRLGQLGYILDVALKRRTFNRRALIDAAEFLERIAAEMRNAGAGDGRQRLASPGPRHSSPGKPTEPLDHV